MKNILLYKYKSFRNRKNNKYEKLLSINIFILL